MLKLQRARPLCAWLVARLFHAKLLTKTAREDEHPCVARRSASIAPNDTLECTPQVASVFDMRPVCTPTRHAHQTALPSGAPARWKSRRPPAKIHPQVMPTRAHPSNALSHISAAHTFCWLPNFAPFPKTLCAMCPPLPACTHIPEAPGQLEQGVDMAWHAQPSRTRQDELRQRGGELASRPRQQADILESSLARGVAGKGEPRSSRSAALVQGARQVKRLPH